MFTKRVLTSIILILVALNIGVRILAQEDMTIVACHRAVINEVGQKTETQVTYSHIESKNLESFISSQVQMESVEEPSEELFAHFETIDRQLTNIYAANIIFEHNKSFEEMNHEEYKEVWNYQNP